MFCEYFITIILLKYALCDDASYGVNVGTVLFTESDNTRKCWSNEELALLRARLVFQDVLPKSSALVMEDDKFVTALVNYFRLAVNRVTVMTAGKVKEINLKALADTIGGYLHHVVIPLGKHSFYAGKISYDSARQLTELYDEMKIYLRTDGHSWTPPIKTPNKVKREAAAHSSGGSAGCADLVYNHSGNGPITIPMPFLDSKTKPTSIAVPFKAFPLRNLQSKSSACILVKYYDTAICCMQQQNASPADITKFNNDFSAFLNSEILPHLNDEELYPAFGGALKLKESLSHGGGQAAAAAAGGKSGGSGDAAAGGGDNKATDENDYYGDDDKSTTIMFGAVAVVILIWIITGIIYCCCRMRRKKRDLEKQSSLAKRGSKTSKLESSPSRGPKPVEFAPTSSIGMKKASHESIKPKTSQQNACCKPLEKEKSKEKPKSSSKLDRKSGGVCHVKDTGIPPVPVKEPPKSAPPSAAKTPPKTPPKPKTPPPRKEKPKEVAKCPKCSRTKCGHSVAVGTALVKSVRSAPVSFKKGAPTYIPEKGQISATSQTSAEKPVVFGYDFETSSTDSSSIGESSSSSGTSTPKKS